jgi:hypothetical protein
MLIIEVHGRLVTWPEKFANTMMSYYEKHGVPFVLHGDAARKKAVTLSRGAV